MTFRYLNRKRSHDEGQVVAVVRPSEVRVEPRCAQYGVVAAACSTSTRRPRFEAKQAVLIDNLRQIGRVAPDTLLPPIMNDSPWGYRRKARLGVKDVSRKGKVLVGFRERGSSFVADVPDVPRTASAWVRSCRCSAR